MRKKVWVRAEAAVRRDKTSVCGRTPAAVIEALRGSEGDTLVFEEGNTSVVQRAALSHKTYFVVTLERAAPPAPTPAAEQPAPPGESLQELVDRKLAGGGR